MNKAFGRTLALCLFLGCAGPAEQAPPPEGPVSRTELSDESARERALEAAREAGYDAAGYEVVSVERDGGRWAVSFQVPPPTPPGGHLLVYVDAESGETEVHHGE